MGLSISDRSESSNKLAKMISGIKVANLRDVYEYENLYPSLKADLQRPGLKISHININGLLNKLLDIKALLFSLNLDILAITEPI